jgi:uncharacterized repeat protein (TIGR01451 family)
MNRKPQRSHLVSRSSIRRAHFRARFETLEQRRMLAADLMGAKNSRISDLLLSQEVSQQVAQTSSGPLASVNSAAALLSFNAAGKVGIRVTAEDVNEVLPALTSVGFEVTGSAPELHFIEGYIAPGMIAALESLGEGLLGVLPMYRPYTNVGATTSQADVVMETDRVRGTTPTGFDGTGVKIGVLSDSYNNLNGAAAGVTSGDLPANVQVLSDLTSGGSDEGRAMLELVHDLAPGAALAFATAFQGEANFAQQIRNLANPAIGNAKIIVDDVGYLTAPFFQDGIVAQAVNDVSANNGVTYFSSAGNQARQSYESTNINFVADPGNQFGTVYDFDPSGNVDTRQLITIPNGGEFRPSLQWDDPFFTASGVDTDIDFALVVAGTNTVVAVSDDNSIQNQTPSEFISFTNTTANTQFELIIARFAGPNPGRLKYIDFGGATIAEHATNSSTIFGHAAAANAMSVGAVFYGNQAVPESFTSAGPSTILFTSTGAPQAVEVRQTPRISAIDGTNTTFFGNDSEGDGFPNFFGTSAAAPHAAAVAALVKQANPTFTPAQLRARLESTVRDLSTPGYDNLTGLGIINAYDAVFGAVVPATINFSEGFETNTVLTNAWETNSTGSSRILVSTTNTPNNGQRHLTMDTFASFSSVGNGLNEAILHVNALGFTNVQLTFDQRENSDEDHAMPATFTGSGNFDGVAFSVDGINWRRVVSLTGTESTNTNQTRTFNLSTLATNAGVTLSNDTRIKFQQFDNSPFSGNDGFAFDRIQVTGVAPIMVSVGDATVSEPNAGNTNLGFTVTLSAASTNPITVNFATSNGTATAGSDYTTTTGTLTFAPGETSKTVLVPVMGDLMDEDDETLNLTLSNATNSIIVDSQGLGTILDNDAAPTVSVSDVSVTEGEVATYTVSLSAVSGKTITVLAATAPGTAVTGTDFGSESVLVTFSPGSTAVNVLVNTVDDAIAELTENFSLGLSTPTNATIADGQGVATILDNDPAPDVTLSLTSAPTDPLAGATISYTLVASNIGNATATNAGVATLLPAELINVQWTSVSAGGATGSLASGTGDINESGLSIPVGGTITYTISAKIPESTPANTPLIGSGGIFDSGELREDGNLVTFTTFVLRRDISIVSVSALEGNSGTTPFLFTITRTGDLSEPTTVDYTVSPGDDAPPTFAAADANDFVGGILASGQVTFGIGETTKQITIEVQGDTTPESPFDVFKVVLSNPTGGALLDPTLSVGEGLIGNDDTGLALSTTDVAKAEGTGTGSTPFTFTVTRAGVLADQSTVDFALTLSGTNAANAADFGGTLPSGSIVFLENESSKTITINVIQDNIVEADETFSVVLSNPVGASLVTPTSESTISNDDQARLFIAEAVDLSVLEGQSGTTNVPLTITLSNPLDIEVTIPFDTTSLGGNATAGVDYVAQQTTLVIPANTTTLTHNVVINGDVTLEPDETFLALIPISISLPPRNVTLDENANGVFIKIVNDDSTFSIAAVDVTKMEGTGNDFTPYSFTVTRDGNLSTPSSVNFAVTGTGTLPVVASDFGTVFPSGTLNFAANETTKTITINVKKDNLVEANETFRVSLSSPTAAATLVNATADSSIMNDDQARLFISEATDLSVAEGNSGTKNVPLTITLSNPVDIPLTLPFETSGPGSASAGSDYVAQSVSLTIPANTTSFVRNVVINGDTVSEPNESFFAIIPVTLQLPARDVFLDEDANGVFIEIVNDDAEIEVLDGQAVFADGGTLAFGDLNFGNTPLQRTLTVKNISTVPLTLSPAVLAGSGFTIVTNVPSSLAPGASTSLVLQLDSTTVGQKTASLSFTTNDFDENPFNFTLTGTIKAPEVEVRLEGALVADNSGLVAFGDAPLTSAGITKTLTVRNVGQAVLTLSPATISRAGFTIVTNLPTSLAPGSFANLVVRLDTTVFGPKTATLSFANNDSNENPYNFGLTGNVTAPEADVFDGVTPVPDNTGIVAFGNKLLKSEPAVKTLTVKNNGNAVLNLSAATLQGSGFTIVTNLPSTLAPGASTNLVVRQETTTFGPKSATLSFVNNDPFESPYNFVLTGNITAPEADLFNGSVSVLDNTGLVEFGIAPMGSAAITKTLTLKNTGNGLLTLSPATLLGSGFTIVTNLPATLAPGASANLVVRLDTTTFGPKSAALSFVNSDPFENPYNVALTGNVTAPEADLFNGSIPVLDNTGKVEFGNALLGSDAITKTLTLRNNGNALLTLSPATLVGGGFTIVTNLPATLAPGASASLVVRLDTTTFGPKSAALSFVNNDPWENPYNVALTGNVTVPEADLFNGSVPVLDNTGMVEFGNAPLGSAAITKTLTLRNNGNALLTLSPATLVGGGFTIVTNLPASLAPGASASLVVRLDTTTFGPKSAVLSFVNNDPWENPYNVALTGNVTAPEADVFDGTTPVPDNRGIVSFGNAPLASSPVTKTLIVRNTGLAPLTLSAATLVGSGFTIVNNLPASLSPGSSANLVVRLETTTPGFKNAVLSFVNNDPFESPYNFSLTGNVTVPEADLFFGSTPIPDNSGSVSFGNAPLGSSPLVRTLTLRNSGAAPLSISPATLQGSGFTIQTNLPSSLAPGATANLVVRLNTEIAGTKNATLSFVNGDANENPYNISLVGTVTVPELDVFNGDAAVLDNVGAVEFGSAQQGSARILKTLSIRNTGNATLTLSPATITGAGFVIVTNLPTTLLAGTSANLVVAMETVAAGEKNATLTFGNNDPNENPFNFALRGNVTTAPAGTAARVDSSLSRVDDETEAIDTIFAEFGTFS